MRSTPIRSLLRTTDRLDRPGSGRHNRPHTALATWLMVSEPPATAVDRRRNNEAPKLRKGRVGHHADHDSLRNDLETLRLVPKLRKGRVGHHGEHRPQRSDVGTLCLARGESLWRRFQELGRTLSLQASKVRSAY